ncbi:MAG: metalloregulator ArsR/SmtB family transcription factor [Planctomycetota bacterium]
MADAIGKALKALANPTRRRILELLREGDLTAGAIADHFQVTKPAISHHLSALKNAGLASERRDGQHVIYTLEEGSIAEVWDGFLAKLCGSRRRRRAAQKDKRKTSLEPDEQG